MERHRNLYKENKSFGSQKNRDRQNASRVCQRKEQYQGSRNLSVSPTPQEVNKENLDTVGLSQMDLPKLSTGKNLSRKEAYLLRFIQWKEAKKQEALKKVTKRPPFVPAGKAATKAFESKGINSFLPKNQGTFKAPMGLNQPAAIAAAANENMTVASSSKGLRKSFYTAVPTPTKKQNPEVSRDQVLNRNPSAPLSTLSIKAEKVKKTSATSASRIPPATKPSLKPLAFALPKSTVLAVPKPPTKCVAKPPAKDVTSKAASGAVGKHKLLQSKRAAPQKNAKLAVSFKAKKPPGKNNIKTLRCCAPKVQLVPISETPTLASNENPFEAFVTSTRLKNASDNLSDMCDTISPVEHELQKTLGTAPVSGRRGSSTVKRALLPSTSKAVAKREKSGGSVKRVYNFLEFDPDLVTPLKDSIGANQKGQANENENDQVGVKGDLLAEPEATRISQKSPPAAATLTPGSPKENDERPINYLSPFVSVSRGKVSAKKEREKRNSVYVPHSPATTASKALSPPPKLSVEMLRTLETVRYFRKQLDDEIARLHALCDRWEAYRAEELTQIQDSNADDMINVTIGQTRLLTSKKFMQFKGLIDRCEALTLGGSGAIADDGREETKLITAVDLEGFWSMVGLQVDNVNKRFENLQRWKDNAWHDPDEATASTAKGTLNKVKKTKAPVAKKVAKPSSALQQMLRKVHSEMRKNKTAAPAADNEDTTLTEILKRRSGDGEQESPNSQTRRISVIVRDRKYHSPARTIISISSPMQRRISLGRKSAKESPRLSPHISKFHSAMNELKGNGNDLLKSVLLGATGQQRRSSFTPRKTPRTHGRKSILKTPGAAKSARKSVIFSEQLRVRKFKFTVDGSEEEEEEEEECLINRLDNMKNAAKEQCNAVDEEDADTRTYRLRTRKVVLRPSSEFVIPK